MDIDRNLGVFKLSDEDMRELQVDEPVWPLSAASKLLDLVMVKSKTYDLIEEHAIDFPAGARRSDALNKVWHGRPILHMMGRQLLPHVREDLAAEIEDFLGKDQ